MFEQFGKWGVVGLVLGAGSLILSGFMAKRTNDMAKKLDKSVDELTKMTPVEVAQDVVNKAVENAVNREVEVAVDKAVVDATRQVRGDAKHEIAAQVRTEIKDIYDDLKQDVRDKLEQEVEDIDIASLQEAVKKKGAELAAKKVELECTNVVNEFREQFRSHFRNVTGTMDLLNYAVNGWRNDQNQNNQNGRGIRFTLD